MTDEHREAGAPNGSSQEVFRLAQLDLGLLAHSDVVRTGSALAAAPGRACLRCEGHDRQLAACFGQFSRLSQRRFARAAGLEDGENAPARPRWLGVDPTFVGFLVSDLGCGLCHVEKR